MHCNGQWYSSVSCAVDQSPVRRFAVPHSLVVSVPFDNSISLVLILSRLRNALNQTLKRSINFNGTIYATSSDAVGRPDWVRLHHVADAWVGWQDVDNFGGNFVEEEEVAGVGAGGDDVVADELGVFDEGVTVGAAGVDFWERPWENGSDVIFKLMANFLPWINC